VEVYERLESFFSEPNNLSSALASYSHLANLEMVRHLLDIGADIRGTSVPIQIITVIGTDASMDT
jgi:hypothetical protein